MALNIGSNTPSYPSTSQLDASQKTRERLLAELASGNTTATDSASQAISQSLSAQSRGDEQALENVNDGIAMTQTAADAVTQIQYNTQQIQNLAVKAGDGALSASDRQALQHQVDALTQANSAIVQGSNYNGIPLLGGKATLIQAGPDGKPASQISVNGPDLGNSLNGYDDSLAARGVIDVSSQAAAFQAQSQIGEDLSTLNTVNSSLGAAIDAFHSTLSGLQSASINTQAANSRISDVDYARQSAALARSQIANQSALAMRAQANVTPHDALTLLA
ncbi:flagellin [Paludibacterium yongneupense]|uniref:flagellin N-terminal helical domain-containing protein n=1 Tax=Paludibacterium yongneupense TaxID=400061 RepID=UPI00041CC68C|nr:flagellin [Paludibacterium yongneupense]